MTFQHITIPQQGEPVTAENGVVHIPDTPIIAFIEGDGIGHDIMTASKRIWDAAVEVA